MRLHVWKNLFVFDVYLSDGKHFIIIIMRYKYSVQRYKQQYIPFYSYNYNTCMETLVTTLYMICKSTCTGRQNRVQRYKYGLSLRTGAYRVLCVCYIFLLCAKRLLLSTDERRTKTRVSQTHIDSIFLNKYWCWNHQFHLATVCMGKIWRIFLDILTAWSCICPIIINIVLL